MREGLKLEVKPGTTITGLYTEQVCFYLPILGTTVFMLTIFLGLALRLRGGWAEDAWSHL